MAQAKHRGTQSNKRLQLLTAAHVKLTREARNQEWHETESHLLQQQKAMVKAQEYVDNPVGAQVYHGNELQSFLCQKASLPKA